MKQKLTGLPTGKAKVTEEDRKLHAEATKKFDLIKQYVVVLYMRDVYWVQLPTGDLFQVGVPFNSVWHLLAEVKKCIGTQYNDVRDASGQPVTELRPNTAFAPYKVSLSQS